MHLRLAGARDHANLVLDQRTWVIGRDPRCDVVLEDPGVAPRHATVRRALAGVEVVDLAGSTGVFVDGMRVARAVVTPGHVIRVGATDITLDMRDEAPLLPVRPMPAVMKKDRVPLIAALVAGLVVVLLLVAGAGAIWAVRGGLLGGVSPEASSPRAAAPGSASPRGGPAASVKRPLPMPNAARGIEPMVFDRNPFEGD